MGGGEDLHEPQKRDVSQRVELDALLQLTRDLACLDDLSDGDARRIHVAATFEAARHGKVATLHVSADVDESNRHRAPGTFALRDAGLARANDAHTHC